MSSEGPCCHLLVQISACKPGLILTKVRTWQTGQLDFVRRKAIPFGRHAEARAAIFGKAKPPPFAPMAPAPKQRNFGTSQRTLQDLWKQPIAAQEIASDDMQF